MPQTHVSQDFVGEVNELLIRTAWSNGKFRDQLSFMTPTVLTDSLVVCLRLSKRWMGQ